MLKHLIKFTGELETRAPKVADRVRLISTSDRYTALEPGALGTVALVDHVGTVHVNWDDGSTFGMIPGEDRWETV
jgi:hypothetical protein